MSNKQTKNALILTHLQSDEVSSLNFVLEERNFKVSPLNVARYGAKDIDPLHPDVVIIMGGQIGAYQADDYPFLHDEMAIVKARAEADLPTLGICLGSQIMARALGADVYRGSHGMEVGWSPLSVNEKGKQSPARHLDGEHTNMIHAHGDTFDLPEGATLLASSAKYPHQIYSYGKNLIGLQCHPELTKPQFNEWLVMFQNMFTGKNALLDIHQLRRDIDEHIDTLNKQTHLFFHEWLDQAGL